MKLFRYPLYGGVATLAAYAIDYLADATWSQGALAIAILFNIGTLGYKASKWRGYKPSQYGIVGAVLVFLANATPEAQQLELVGIAILVILSLWTASPPKNPGESPLAASKHLPPISHHEYGTKDSIQV